MNTSRIFALAALWAAVALAIVDGHQVTLDAKGHMRNQRLINAREDSKLIKCDTTKGPLHIQLTPDRSPRGAERLLSMVRDAFFTDLALFRVVPGMFAQFGISDNSKMNDKWKATFEDDEPESNARYPKGTISFAGNGKDSRNTQLFVSLGDGAIKGTNPWETAVGHVVSNIRLLDRLYSDYGDGPPWGNGPSQETLLRQGNAYLHEGFPGLDYIKSCKVNGEASPHISAAPEPIGRAARQTQETVREAPAASADVATAPVVHEAPAASADAVTAPAVETTNEAEANAKLVAQLEKAEQEAAGLKAQIAKAQMKAAPAAAVKQTKAAAVKQGEALTPAEANAAADAMEEAKHEAAVLKAQLAKAQMKAAPAPAVKQRKALTPAEAYAVTEAMVAASGESA